MNKDLVLWSKATIYLGTLTLETTGGLSVSVTDKIPQGTLVSLDEVIYDDIMAVDPLHPFPHHPEIKYIGGEPEGFTTVIKKWNLTSTGSGTLTAKAIFDWEFSSASWANPDAIAEGPENVSIRILVNDKIIAYFEHATAHLPYIVQDRQISGPAQSFGAGEINYLTVQLVTNANGGWVNIPKKPAPPLVSIK